MNEIIMNEKMESNEFNIQKLDEDFKLGLQIIRRNIINLTHPQDAKLCGEWLQKLRNSTDERRLRNVLLQKLTVQVQNNSLEYPFDACPEEGPLYKLLETGEFGSSWSEDEISSNHSNSLQDGDHNYFRQDKVCQLVGNSGPCLKNVNFSLKTVKEIESPDSKQEEKNKYYNEFNKIRKDHQVKKINSLMNTVAELKAQNNSLCNEVDSLKQFCRQTEENLIQSRKDSETKSLEIEKLNVLVENYKNLLTDYKNIVNENVNILTERLNEAIDKNAVLQSGLENLKSVTYSFWTSKIKNVENEFGSEMKVIESKISLEREKNSIEISKLKKLVGEKDRLIEMMDSQIKKQCTKMKDKMKKIIRDFNDSNRENEIHYRKKTEFLKKKIDKLEKINKKIIQEYEKKIISLSKEHECKIKTMKYREADKLIFDMENKLKNLETDYKQMYNSVHNKSKMLETQKELQEN